MEQGGDLHSTGYSLLPESSTLSGRNKCFPVRVLFPVNGIKGRDFPHQSIPFHNLNYAISYCSIRCVKHCGSQNVYQNFYFLFLSVFFFFFFFFEILGSLHKTLQKRGHLN